MSTQYSCSICGTCELRSDGEAESGSTEGDCKACDNFLQQSEHELRDSMSYAPAFPTPTNDTRSRIAAVFVNRNRPLECLNFCLSSLDRSSPACSSHPNYNPIFALKVLTRYKKSDFDPSSPPPFDLQPHKHFELLFTLDLAAFAVYGDSTFTTSCLRRAHMSNQYLYQMLAEKQFSVPAELYNDLSNRIRLRIQDTGIYRLRFRAIWGTAGVKEWLRANEEELKKKACDAVGCGKTEEVVGEFKVCKGCVEYWYCGVECQTIDWKEGGHKRRCKESKQRLNKWMELEQLSEAQKQTT